MRRITLILVAFLVVTGVNAQLLWKISGNGLKQPSYLFGTHHLAPVSTIDNVTGFADALGSVSEVYGEIEMDKMHTMEFQQKMASMLMAPADSTLSRVFTPEQLAAIDRMFSRYTSMPFSVSNFENYRPAVLSTMLTMLIGSKAFPEFNSAQQLDAVIQSMAKDKGKAVKSFESVEFQLNLLYGNSIAEQAKELLKALDNEDVAVEMARLLTEAYVAGNIDELCKLMNDPRSGMTPDQADRMIYDRNNAWVQLLLGILPTVSIMAVVGAGHLPGERGLINLLRKLGFTVTPVE